MTGENRGSKTARATADKTANRRIALLVIHGIGQQNPLETLDLFARGLWRAANNHFKLRDEERYRAIHSQVPRRTPDAPEVWLENYITLETDAGAPTFDIYEYYWAHRMTDQASIGDIVDWLREISKYACKYYRTEREEADEDTKRKFKERYRKEPQLRNLFEPNGQFHKNGYLRSLGRALHYGLPLLALIESSSLSNWPLLKALFSAIVRRVKRVLIDYVGDIVVYTTTDRKARHFEVRQSILRDARTFLDQVRYDPRYAVVLVAAHSLGSVIAYDTLNRLHNKPIAKNQIDDEKKAYDRLRGLTTFGSPLDKIGFFFRQQSQAEAHIRRQMLNRLHSFKRRPYKDPDIDETDENYVAVRGAMRGNLDHVRWINFYDPNDPVSGHLDLYRVDENRQLRMDARFGVAHTAYWENEEMYEGILNFFSDELYTTVKMWAPR